MSFSINRRQVNAGLAAAGFTIWTQTRARAADFYLRQYHNQPVEAPLHKRIVEMWAAIEKETSGRVRAEIFPQNNRDPDPLGKLIAGEIQFLTLAGNGLSAISPPCDVQATPYSFKNSAQVYRALDSDLGAYLRDELRAKGLYAVPFGCFENGMHQISITGRPVRNAADFRGLKVRIPGSQLYQDFFRSLGADVHTMNIARMYDALKSGQIEAQDDPLDVMELFKLYEVQKYVSMTDHSWSGYNQCANLRMWQALPADVQRVIETNVRKYAVLQRADTDKLNETLRTELEHRGMMFNNVDLASFRPALTAFYPRWKAHVGTRAWDLLEKHTGRLA
ncbi:MAG: TRAP transporter substrate-binding protein [Alphaproteobacteria bacterium]|nr:TRAP transporter substrate-binding protein [Alphaproteobacteria bacterium]